MVFPEPAPAMTRSAATALLFLPDAMLNGSLFTIEGFEIRQRSFGEIGL